MYAILFDKIVERQFCCVEAATQIDFDGFKAGFLGSSVNPIKGENIVLNRYTSVWNYIIHPSCR